MLRIPTRQEVIDLFVTPNDVTGACALLDRARNRVNAVANRCDRLARRYADEATELRELADWADADARAQEIEASRARRVHTRLAELLA